MLIMENSEEVLQILERFTKLKQKDIPKELDDYLCYVAKTGDTVYRWANIKYLFREKLMHVIKDFHDSTPSVDDLPQYPNVDPFNYETMKSALLERLDLFNAAPFTVQRLCELLTDPRKQYSRIDKYMRALEKNILVVSTVEPGRRQADSENGDSLDSVVNGDISLEVNVDIDMENESIFDMENQTTASSSSSSSSSSSTSTSNKPDESNNLITAKKVKTDLDDDNNDDKLKSNNNNNNSANDENSEIDMDQVSKEESKQEEESSNVECKEDKCKEDENIEIIVKEEGEERIITNRNVDKTDVSDNKEFSEIEKDLENIPEITETKQSTNEDKCKDNDEQCEKDKVQEPTENNHEQATTAAPNAISTEPETLHHEEKIEITMSGIDVNVKSPPLIESKIISLEQQPKENTSEDQSNEEEKLKPLQNVQKFTQEQTTESENVTVEHKTAEQMSIEITHVLPPVETISEELRPSDLPIPEQSGSSADPQPMDENVEPEIAANCTGDQCANEVVMQSESDMSTEPIKTAATAVDDKTFPTGMDVDDTSQEEAMDQ